jgi:hypothetical protein
MQRKTNQSFTNLLHEAPDLQKFVAKVEHLEKINQIIASKLDPNLAENCQVANLRDGILILSTTSPAWNHKLRFSTLDLLSALRSDPRLSGLKGIEIKVDYLPQTENTRAPNSKARPAISATSAKYIHQAAENISNERLAAALRKLADKNRKTWQ